MSSYYDPPQEPIIDDGDEHLDAQESSLCRACIHDWGEHNYDKDGHELPDSGPCSVADCACKEFK